MVLNDIVTNSISRTVNTQTWQKGLRLNYACIKHKKQECSQCVHGWDWNTEKAALCFFRACAIITKRVTSEPEFISPQVTNCKWTLSKKKKMDTCNKHVPTFSYENCIKSSVLPERESYPKKGLLTMFLLVQDLSGAKRICWLATDIQTKVTH